MAQHDEDLWFVQLPNGAVRAMTLDDLDAAFQSGTIDEGTLVRRDGQSAWTKLSDELGASEPAPQTPSVRPVVMDFDDDDFAPPSSSKKRVIAVLGIAAAAAIALAAFGATKLGGTHAEVNASVANAAQLPQLPPSDPQPSSQKNALTEEQKKALADKDAELHQKMDQRRRDRATNSPTPTTHTTQPPPFHNGGDAYDPLNAKL
jgi:hypothetical protein